MLEIKIAKIQKSFLKKCEIKICKRNFWNKVLKKCFANKSFEKNCEQKIAEKFVKKLSKKFPKIFLNTNR